MAGFRQEFLLLDPFDRDYKANFVRHGRQESLYLEIASLQRAGCLPAGTKLTFRTWAAPDRLDVQSQRFSNTAEGKVSGYFVVFIVDFLYRRALEGGGGKLCRVEEIRALNVFIAVGKVRVDAVGFYLDADRILRWIILIERECPTEGVEAAIHVADPKVPYLEQNCRVDGVDLKGIGLGNRCRSEGEDT